MALSGSTNYSLNRNELVKASLRLIGVGVTGMEPSADEISDCSQALNIMLKAWQAEGLELWLRRSKTITLTAGTSSYTLGPSGSVVMDRPLKVLQVLRRDTSSNDVPMFPMSREQYWTLTPKTSSGVPNSYYYDSQITNGVLYIWQVPTTADIALYPSLIVDYYKPIDDMDSGTDDFEFPQEWYEAVKYGLALRIAPEYGLPQPLRQQLYYEFIPIFERAKFSDVEGTSLFLQPNTMGF